MNSIQQKILANLQSTYCRITPSKIHGVGIIAIRDIPKAENPFPGVPEHSWVAFSPDQLAVLDPQIQEMIRDFFVTDKNNDIQIPSCGLNGMDISFFLNQSENPNVATADEGSTFYTTRKIKAGEELTSSYATYDKAYKNENI